MQANNPTKQYCLQPDDVAAVIAYGAGPFSYLQTMYNIVNAGE